MELQPMFRRLSIENEKKETRRKTREMWGIWSQEKEEVQEESN